MKTSLNFTLWPFRKTESLGLSRIVILTMIFICLPKLGGAQTTLSDLGIPIFPHQANFLAPYCLSHVFPGRDAAERASCLVEHKSHKNTHFYVYPYNEKDYSKWRAPSFDFYSNPQEFRSRLQEIIDAGMAPVVWIFPDDASTLHSSSISQYKAILDNLVPHIDDLVSSYVLGLELREYFTSEETAIVGAHLDSLTDKLIGIHQGSHRTDGIDNEWADYLVYQYYFDLTEAEVIVDTKDVLRKVTDTYGKPVVAGEYARFSTPEPTHIKLGDAAMSADPRMKLYGFGNGGTPLSGASDSVSPEEPENLAVD
jgi:hypothetical protein